VVLEGKVKNLHISHIKGRVSWVQWLMPVNPSNSRRQISGGLRFKANPGKEFARPYLENTQHTKKGLM
jgi:hypothetical protein